MNKQYVTLRDYMEVVDYQINEPWKYCWDCYGMSAFGLDAGTFDGSEGREYTISLVFDLIDQTVYEMSAYDYDNDKAYRYINPDYVEAQSDEAERKGLDANRAWENTDYVNLEVPEDILEKSNAIFKGEEYDTRVTLALSLDEQEVFFLTKQAHEKDMSLNDYVRNAVLEYIDDIKALNNYRVNYND